jgi:hypothetical protein
MANVSDNSTNTTGLPIEVILHVSSYCSSSQLCTLVRLNTALCHTLTPAIYTDIRLESRRATEKFSDTLACGRSHLKTYPRSIYINPKRTTTKLLHPTAHSIRQALLLTVNLHDLTLSLPSKAVKTILTNIQYPFLLRRLASPFISSREFPRFLHSQQKLEELVVLRNMRGTVTVRTSIRNLDLESLPRLQSVSADLESLLALVPGRPITQVSTGSSVLCSGDYHAFAALLSQASAQPEVIEVSSYCAWVASPCDIGDLACALHYYHIQPKSLTMNIVFPESTLARNPNIWAENEPHVGTTLH